MSSIWILVNVALSFQQLWSPSWGQTVALGNALPEYLAGRDIAAHDAVASSAFGKGIARSSTELFIGAPTKSEPNVKSGNRH